MKQENKSVAELLTDFRTALGMNISSFARNAGVDIAHYSRIEKGVVLPGFKTLHLLVCEYNIDPRIFFHCIKGGRKNGNKKGVKNKGK